VFFAALYSAGALNKSILRQVLQAVVRRWRDTDVKHFPRFLKVLISLADMRQINGVFSQRSPLTFPIVCKALIVQCK